MENGAGRGTDARFVLRLSLDREASALPEEFRVFTVILQTEVISPVLQETEARRSCALNWLLGKRTWPPAPGGLQAPPPFGGSAPRLRGGGDSEGQSQGLQSRAGQVFPG